MGCVDGQLMGESRCVRERGPEERVVLGVVVRVEGMCFCECSAARFVRKKRQKLSLLFHLRGNEEKFEKLCGRRVGRFCVIRRLGARVSARRRRRHRQHDQNAQPWT